MNKRFANSRELASYLIDIDNRKWGMILYRFTCTTEYVFYNWTPWKQDLNFITKQHGPYHKVTREECIDAFVKFINNTSLTFPLYYDCVYDSYQTYEVTYIPDDQMTFFD